MRRRIRLQKRGVWQRDLEVLGGAVVVESSLFVVVARGKVACRTTIFTAAIS